MSVLVYLADGFEEMEAVTLIDILRRAGVDVTTVSVTDSKAVVGDHNIAILADALFDDIDHAACEMIVLPGGVKGANNLAAHEGLKSVLDGAAGERKWLAAICAAPTVLGRHGLLEGRVATCYPGHEQKLQGAQFTETRVVMDDNIVTSRGPGTAIEFALKLVEILKDAETAGTLVNKMLIAAV
ncbi:MAG: DJ-1 family glyoxalase III [Solirubrobacterales bacterium]